MILDFKLFSDAIFYSVLCGMRIKENDFCIFAIALRETDNIRIYVL